MIDNTTHDGFWTPHGGKLLDIKVVNISSPIYSHETDYESLNLVSDFVFVKCETLNLEKDRLIKGYPYKSKINGVVRIIWHSHISRIDNLPVFNMENISDEEFTERNRIKTLHDIL